MKREALFEGPKIDSAPLEEKERGRGKKKNENNERTMGRRRNKREKRGK